MREDRTNDIDGIEDYEDIRQVPLEPARTAGNRQNPPIGDSYIGGRPRRERVSRRKPGTAEKDMPDNRPSDKAAKSEQHEREAERTGYGVPGDGPAGRSAVRSGQSGGFRTSGTAGNAEWSAKAGRSEKPGRSEMPGRSRESVWPEKPDRSEKPGRSKKSGRSEKPGRPERPDRSGKSGGSEKPGRSGGTGSGKSLSVLAFLLAMILGISAGLGGGYYLWGWERPYTVDLKAVEVPEYVQQDFIRKNIFSRPDVGRQRVDKIVIHYVANPGSTAKNNRDYFDSLADQDPQKTGSSASSHFVVGLEGEVIQCIPVNEIAYANAPLNNTTVAIEVCHPDDSGKFNDATYQSVVDLTAFLCRQLKLTSKDVIRHYDVNGKVCPKYYVEHEDAWPQFLEDVKNAMKSVN